MVQENGVLSIWMCRVPVTSGMRQTFEGALSGAETAQARRFVAPRDRELYLAAHGLLRLMLGASTGSDPSSLAFAAGRWGKPYLLGRHARPAPAFNVAHSGDSVLVAMCAGSAVGVDIERHRSLRDALGIGERFFSSREAELLRGLEPAARESAFFRLWTRKEAVVKAAGLSVAGLSREVEVLPVSAELGTGSAEVPPGAPAPLRLGWADLPVDTGYSAAYAVPGPKPLLALHELGLQE